MFKRPFAVVLAAPMLLLPARSIAEDLVANASWIWSGKNENLTAEAPFPRAATADAWSRIGSSESNAVLLDAAVILENALDVRSARARGLIRIASPELTQRPKVLASKRLEESTRRLLLEAAEKANAGRRLGSAQ